MTRGWKHRETYNNQQLITARLQLRILKRSRREATSRPGSLRDREVSRGADRAESSERNLWKHAAERPWETHVRSASEISP